MALFLLVGCATLVNLLSEAPEVFTTIIDDKEFMIQLPKEFPNVDKATLYIEFCRPGLCRQTYDVNDKKYQFNLWYTYIDEKAYIFGVVLIPLDGSAISGWLLVEGIPIPTTKQIFEEQMMRHLMKGIHPPQNAKAHVLIAWAD